MSESPYIVDTMLVSPKQLDHIQLASPNGDCQGSGSLQRQGKVSDAVQVSFVPGNN